MWCGCVIYICRRYIIVSYTQSPRQMGVGERGVCTKRVSFGVGGVWDLRHSNAFMIRINVAVKSWETLSSGSTFHPKEDRASPKGNGGTGVNTR